MIKKLFVVSCLLFAVGIIPAMAVATADSSTWEWKWEGDVYPLASGLMEEAWFGTSGTAYEAAQSALNAGPPTIDTIFASTSALWYKAPAASIPAFDFSTGASLEWRFKSHYGTANSGQVFVEFGDGTNTLRPTFTYPDGPYTTGLMKFNGGAANETSYPIGMKSSVPGNDFHTFRFVCLGNDFSLYLDDDPTPVLTGTSDTRPGEQAINNFRFGDKLMQTDFDYIRFTTEGAFAPPEPPDPPGPEDANFIDRTLDLGLDFGIDHAAWGDYNNDGWVDLYAAGSLWRNNGGISFSPIESFGYGIFGDYDNDGYLDIYTWGSNKLYRNVNGTSFVEVTMPSISTTSSRSASWLDYDNDGYLDIYLPGFVDGSIHPDRMLMNDGAGSFSVAWSETAYPARGVTSCDFDEDGDVDIYVSNYNLYANRFWLNNGTGSFPLTDAASAYGIIGHYTPGDDYAYGHTIGSCWGDIDNDGHIDLFVGNFRHNWGDGSQDYAAFYRNKGPDNPDPNDDWHFELMTQLDGSDWQESYAHPSLGDYDNDGDLDLIFTTQYSGDHARLYRNEGAWAFTNVTSDEDLPVIKDTYQGAWADFDNDGDLDLVIGGKLFVNNMDNSNHWLRVRLKGDGVSVNASAIGAQVRIELDGGVTLTRQVEAGTGEGNQNDLTLHFGLGSRELPVNLEIFWPDDTIQSVNNVAVDQLVEFDSGARTPCDVLHGIGQGIPGDFSRDCRVTWEDYLILSERWLDYVDGDDPNSDSANWEWRWEGNTYPLATFLMEVDWFRDGATDVTDPAAQLVFEEATMDLNADGYATIGNPSALWYKAPAVAIPAFDFTTGVTVEWQFRHLYGNNSAGQIFVEFGDGTNTLRPTLTNYDIDPGPGAFYTGKMTFNSGAVNETSMLVPMHSNWGFFGDNYFHIFRFVCLGNDFSVYMDNDPVAVLTGTTDVRPSEQAINNFRFGDKLMQTDFGYIRWTAKGAFPPASDWLLWNGVEQDLNGDHSVDMSDLHEWVKVWLNCNDPAGCP